MKAAITIPTKIKLIALFISISTDFHFPHL
jgi:hypothetical protein